MLCWIKVRYLTYTCMGLLEPVLPSQLPSPSYLPHLCKLFLPNSPSSKLFGIYLSVLTAASLRQNVEDESRPPGGDVDIGYKLETGTTVTFIAAAIVVGLRFMARMLYARLDDVRDRICSLSYAAKEMPSQVGLNLYSRSKLSSQLYWTLLPFTGRLSRHTFFLNLRRQVQQQYFPLLAQVFCVHALTFAKISICLQYTRVIRSSQRRWLR